MAGHAIFIIYFLLCSLTAYTQLKFDSYDLQTAAETRFPSWLVHCVCCSQPAAA